MKQKKQEENVKTLEQEIREVAEKHKLVNCAFCGTNVDAQMIGFIVGGRTMPLEEFWKTVLNIGRLWQWARDEVRINLNQFEVKQGMRW